MAGAVSVRKTARRKESPAPWTLPRLLVTPLFLALQFYTALHVGFSVVLLAGYVGASLVAFVAYATDKSAAVAGRWRTPESTLHSLAVLGGWPGALLAQQLLRHKTSKNSFVATFWFTVVLNITLVTAWQWGYLSHLKALHLARIFF